MNRPNAPPDPALVGQVWLAITEPQERLYISSHINIDGDGLGAMLGLRRVLEDLGKTATLVLDSQIPRVYRFLSGWDRVTTPDRVDPPDGATLLALDCADMDRLGACRGFLERARTVVNVDHHRSNTGFGHVVWVDTGASSVSEMALSMARQANAPVSLAACEAFYTGIITDTGRFCHTNTTPSSLRAAAWLLDQGVDAGRLGELLYKTIGFNILRLRTMAASTLRLEFGGRVAIMEIRPEMFAETGTKPIDTQEFIDIAAGIEGADLAVLLRPMLDSGGTKVSVRSKNRIDADALARQFGGGGHKNAAGFELSMPLDEARACVIEAIQKVIGGQ